MTRETIPFLWSQSAEATADQNHHLKHEPWSMTEPIGRLLSSRPQGMTDSGSIY